MAALARALMVGTRLILVDEPFQGLAPVLARQYAETLSGLYRLGPTCASWSPNRTARCSTASSARR